MKHLILILSIFTLFSCKKSDKPSYGKKKISKEALEGKKLMENNCYVCHNATSDESNRIGPPMIAIKKHYISQNTTKEEFIADMQNWIKNPTKEKAKMYGAVKKFGVMPKQAFPEETIRQISEYMYDNEIEKPEWFDSHYNKEKEHGKGKEKGKMGANLKDLSHAEKGLKYALATKAVLGKNLMGKIQKEGPLAALEFCNIKAFSLTDSMSIAQNAKIKRVSDKARNPKNKANIEELKYISIFKKDAELNKESAPIVVESLENVHVYYPIKTNGMCLQCHGTPKKEIKEQTFAAIQKLYPKDKAVGYNINEVRGIWNVSFTKK